MIVNVQIACCKFCIGRVARDSILLVSVCVSHVFGHAFACRHFCSLIRAGSQACCVWPRVDTLGETGQLMKSHHFISWDPALVYDSTSKFWFGTRESSSWEVGNLPAVCPLRNIFYQLIIVNTNILANAPLFLCTDPPW